MSCESRHRAIVTRLLTLAGLRDTDADTILCVGYANRYRQRALPTTGTMSVQLDDGVRTRLGITGHSDQATPAWVSSLIDRLHTAADRGNRRALLTLRWLTGGWNDVTPHLTDDDRGWLLTAQRLGITIPPACEVWITRPRTAAVVGRLLPESGRTATVLTEILDALTGIDTVPPDAVQTITPRQVLQMLFGHPFASPVEQQHVLRAILDAMPIVRETLTPVTSLYAPRVLMARLVRLLIGRAAHAYGRSVEHVGGDAVLTCVAGWLRRAGGPAITPAALRDPSPTVVTAITDFLRRWRSWDDSPIGPSLTALIRIWHTGGQNDAVEQVGRTLVQAFAHHRPVSRAVCSTTVALVVAGVIRPPHGDVIVPYVGPISATYHPWSVLAAGAVYAAACQRIGHVPTIGSIDSLIRGWWRNQRCTNTPSPVPVLTVGRERTLLLPVLHAAHGTAAWVDMMLDCIDVADMVDAIGGDPQALWSVLADALTVGGGTIDPWIVVRLAASPCGQAILADLPTIAPPPRWREEDGSMVARRIIPHFVSPWWTTAPQDIRDWWETAIKRIAASPLADLLDSPPPIYPTVMPRAAVVRPTPPLVARAVAHRRWDTLPDEDRRACLGIVFRRITEPEQLFTIALRATTGAAIRDILTMLPTMERLSDRQKHLMRYLTEPDPRGSAG